MSQAEAVRVDRKPRVFVMNSEVSLVWDGPGEPVLLVIGAARVEMASIPGVFSSGDQVDRAVAEFRAKLIGSN